MADATQSPGIRSGMNEKGRERGRGEIASGTVGRDVPDESRERHTEIAVEAGSKRSKTRHRKALSCSIYQP
jgi:hypothetical protein